MSPRPEEYIGGLYSQIKGMSLVDHIRASWITDDLIDTRLDECEVPHEKIFFDGVTHKVSKAVLIRGDSFNKFIKIVLDNKIFPQSKDDGSADKFWKNFGIGVRRKEIDEKHSTVTVFRLSRYSSLPAITWANHYAHYDSGYISDSSKLAVIALSLVPDSMWTDIAKKGLLIGELYGDICNYTWKVKGKGVLYPNKDHNWFSMYKRGMLVSSDEYWWRANICNWGGTIEADRRSYVMSHDVVGIFADMRTMK